VLKLSGVASVLAAGAIVLAIGSAGGQSAAAGARIPKPTISSFTATPTALGYQGGPVTLSAVVGNGATSCTFDANRPVPGLPTTVSCSGGSASTIVTLGANQSNKKFVYKFGLTATGAGGKGTAKAKAVKVTLMPGPANCLTRSFQNTYLAGCDFAGLDLTGANFSGADVAYVDFTGATLTDAVFTGANTQGVTFTNATLTGTDLHGVAYYAYWTSGGVIGTPAALPEYVELIDGYLVTPGARLANADLANADLVATNLSETTFTGANLSNADLHGSGGSQTNFTGADLRGADLTDSQFTIVSNFGGADLSGADLTGAVLTQDVWTNVTWNNTTCPDTTNSDNDGGTCVNNLTP
jgi:uncharacterized protein YjbI with pentapeptide repeats